MPPASSGLARKPSSSAPEAAAHTSAMAGPASWLSSDIIPKEKRLASRSASGDCGSAARSQRESGSVAASASSRFQAHTVATSFGRLQASARPARRDVLRIMARSSLSGAQQGQQVLYEEEEAPAPLG